MEELNQNPMIAHLIDALERGEDIGHYGRLTLAMVAHHFLDHDELCELLGKGNGATPEEISALVRQVEVRGYNPPRRERILEWQKEQEFPVCPNPADPDACNVYRDLKFPDDTYKKIEQYQEAKVEAEQAG
jgi:hypothetical protein